MILFLFKVVSKPKSALRHGVYANIVQVEVFLIKQSYVVYL